MTREQQGISPLPLAIDTGTAELDGYLNEQFISNARRFYLSVEQQLRVVTGCGDDRGPTQESAADINSRFSYTVPVEQGYARFWGGKYGIATVALAACAAVRLEDGITQNGGYWQMVNDVSKVTGGRAIGHSAQANENSPFSFCAHGNGPLGCLLCAKIGAAVDILLTNELVQEVAAADQQRAMGETDTFEQVLTGYRHLAREFARLSPTEQSTDFSIGRDVFAKDIEAGNPVMILGGEHANAADTGVIIGFESRIIASPVEAARAGVPFYGADIMTVGQEIGHLVQERDLFPSWKYFASSGVALTTAVRAALAASDKDPNRNGVLDPRNLPVGIIGEAGEAIDRLNLAYGN